MINNTLCNTSIYKLIFKLFYILIINTCTFNSYEFIRYGYKYNFNYSKCIGYASYKNRVYKI